MNRILSKVDIYPVPFNSRIVFKSFKLITAGKTYTVTGTPTNPGLLPRTLDVVFNSVQDQKLLTDVKFRPKHYSEVMYLNDDELEREQQLKDTILNKVWPNLNVA